jgi:hypothetical protein
VYSKIILIEHGVIPSTKSRNFVSSIYIRIGLGSKFSQLMSWAGDQTVDWTASDGLPSSVIAALSLAVSGMGLSHSDIGKEIHIRK